MNTCCVRSWIAFAATPKLERLDVKIQDVKRIHIETVPLHLFICKKLVHLSLSRVCLPDLEHVCNLRSVKTMQLEANVYANELTFRSLILSCPILEELSIARWVDDNVKVLHIHSQCLKKLSIKVEMLNEDDDENFDEDNSSIIIDSPRLKYLMIAEDMSVRKSIRNANCLCKVEFSGAFYVSAEDALDFFTGISRISNMNISWMTFEFIKENGLFPRFRYLSCLELELYYCTLNYMPMFLEGCPNLRSLNLVLLSISTHETIILSFVPQCLLSSLEVVIIKSYNFGNTELKVAKYFAGNSAFLMELTLVGTPSVAVCKTFFRFPTSSATCQRATVSS